MFNRQLFYSNYLSVPDFTIKKLSEEYPLIGVSFLKLHKFLTTSRPIESVGLPAYRWLQERLDRHVRPEIAHRLKGFDQTSLHTFVSVSTGWADCILIALSKSYAPIQLAISLLRDTLIKDVIDPLGMTETAAGVCPQTGHALLTTCTIPGVFIDYSGSSSTVDEARRQAVANLKTKIDVADKTTSPIVEVQTRPGHLKSAMEPFQRHGFITLPTLGRTDFIATPGNPKKSSLGGFFEFFLGTLLERVSEKKSSAISSETRISFTGDAFISGTDDGPKGEAHHPPVVSLISNGKGLAELLSPHTITAIRQIGTSLSALMHDEATYECYGFIVAAYEAFSKNLEKRRGLLQSEGGLRGPARKELKMLTESISDFCVSVDLCFKDRYRGVYPAGETSATPSLTSHGSFHKVLSCVDAVSNAALAAVSEVLRTKQAGEQPSLELPQLVACCHLGNAPSPQVLQAYLGVGFINVPSPLMFSLEGIAYVLHETGHIFWHSLTGHLGQQFNEVWEKWIRKNDTVVEVLTDVLCDFFALCIAFAGDMTKMWKHVAPVLDELLPRLAAPEARVDKIAKMHFRVQAAAHLYNMLADDHPEQELDRSQEYVNEGKAKAGDDGATWEAMAQLFECLRELKGASHHFFFALAAVQSLSRKENLAQLIAKDKSVLDCIQSFLGRDNDGGELIAFTHKLWQVQRRCHQN